MTGTSSPSPSDVDDARAMCFDQGKPFIHMAPDDPSRIFTEYPNGVREAYEPKTRTITRAWPDGLVERFRQGDDPDLHHPTYVAPA